LDGKVPWYFADLDAAGPIPLKWTPSLLKIHSATVLNSHAAAGVIIIFFGTTKTFIQMSIAQEPTELLELDELLLSEDRPTNRIYGRLTSRNAPSAPTLINDIFDFSSGTDHQEPFDNGGYSVHLDFDVLQPPISYLSMAGQR
jgi:hypothetical protein